MDSLVRIVLLVFIDDAGVVDSPARAIADRSRGLCVQREPPEPRIGTEHLLPVSTPTDIELALRSLLPLQILDRRVILQDELQVELNEICQCANQ